MPSDESKVVVPSQRRVTVREIQLIDRTKEMDVLREAADRAVRGEGGVVFLHGEAGIGKTRLARELGVYARSQGMQVLSGRCPALFRMDGVPPYVLWEEVIKDYLEACTPEQLFRVIGSYPIEVSKLVPELKQKLRTFPQSFPLSPEHSRDRLFEAVSQFITNVSRETPLLVILDDLQWTDKSSLLLLHYLARGVYKESLLLLGAYRHTYVDKKHPLSPVLTELNRERLLQSVPLKRLSFDDVSEMIKRILEQDDVLGEFCRLVFEKTRGNPFFVEEVIKSLKEEEIIYREKNKWKIKEIASIEFPETVKDVIKVRISRLDDESQRVLTLASFVGKDFTFEALRGVTGFEEDKLVEMMEKMLKTGLIKETAIRGEDVYSFVDILVRDVVHEEVSRLKRKRFHRVVGRALEKVYEKEIDEHLGELALHFLESGDKGNALDYFLKAGEKAAKVYANSEAVSYFQSAFKLLEEKESKLREKGRVLERIGDIKNVVEEHDACMEYWNDALLLWKQLGEKETVARLHCKIARVFSKMGDLEKAKECLDKALKILEAEPESVELAKTYCLMAGRFWATGNMAEALPWAEKALELAKKLNDFEGIAESYFFLGTISGTAGDLKKGVECLERALKIALDNGCTEIALRAYNNLGSSMGVEDYERRLEYYEKGYELAKKAGHISFQSWLSSNLAEAYIDMGEMNKGVLLAEESVTLDRKTGHMFHLPLSLELLGYAYHVLGEWDKAEQYYQEAFSISQKLKDFQSISYSYGLRGLLHFDKMEYLQAIEFFEKAYDVCEKVQAKSYAMWYSQGIIRACIELGEFEKAKNLLDSLKEFVLEERRKGGIARMDALRAMLFRAQKKWEESIEHFEKSLQKHEALNTRRWDVYWFAKMVLCEFGRVYLERGQKGDREKARNLLNQALEIFQKMGAKKDIEKTRSRLAYLETGRQIVSEPEPAAEAVLPSHVTTGYADFDKLLFGGIPRNYAVILTSPSCDERDLLVRRFLEAGAKEGQITFHVITKASRATDLAEKFQQNLYVFICNPQADKIVKSLPNVFKLKGVENLNDINIALASAFRRLEATPKKPRRACIEIVSDVLMQHRRVQTRRWLNALIPELRSKGFTTLAVIDSEIHPQQELRAIVGIFEGEINIYKKKAEKFLKIEKMTDQKYLDTELLLTKEKLQK